MRITFLGTSSIDYPSPRGRWLPVAEELSKLGHDVRLLLLHHTYDQLPSSLRRQKRGMVEVEYVAQMHVYGPIGQRRYFGPLALLRVSLQAALALTAAALRQRCDIIHVCKPQPINGLAGLLAGRLLRRPLFVDCDDYEAGGNRFGAAWQRWLVESWEDKLPQYAVGVTVNTRFLQERYRLLGVRPERIAYVPNGVRAEQLVGPSPRRVKGLQSGLGLSNDRIVMYVGTLSQTTHNVGLLLDAFALVVRRVPTARLMLVGDGEDRAALQQQVARLGLDKRVTFVGAVPPSAVPAYLAQAACSVDPVDDDAVARARSPLKLVESLGVGVPVVTGDVGDRNEMLGRDGGVLVEPGNAQSLANGISLILEDNALRRALVAGARARIAQYQWNILAHDWLSLYN